jgi:hypothetical protein
MAETTLTNFRLPKAVKTKLVIMSKVLHKDMTSVLCDLIEFGYVEVRVKNLEKVRAAAVELEQKQNATLRQEDGISSIGV